MNIDELNNKCIETYGITDRPELAGYILTTGEMLDFNEESMKGPWSIRTLDHNNICRVIENSEKYSRGRVIDIALSYGLIRLDYNKREKELYINITKYPTQQQFNTLKNIVRSCKNINIDFSNKKLTYSEAYYHCVKTFTQMEGLFATYCA